MGIGADIAGAFDDACFSITIFRDAGNISGEFVDSELNRQITKPFVANYFRNISFPYDSQALTGDIVQFDYDETLYMVMSKRAEAFENEIALYEGTLYKCNVSGDLRRPTSTRDPVSLQRQQDFTSVRSNCYGLLTEALYGHDLETDQELGMMGLENHELYVPGSFQPQVLDRYEAISGEFLMVTTIKKRRFDNVWVCGVEQDTR